MQTSFNVIGSKGQVIAIFKVKTVKAAPVKIIAMYPAKKKADKIVVLNDLRNKWELNKQDIGHCFNAEINLTKKTVRIFGTKNEAYNRETKQYGVGKFDLTFGLGDYAEYDSYNFIYTGPIQADG